MYQVFRRRFLPLATLIAGVILLAGTSRATVVEFQTSMGNFEVNLYDIGTPQTVANFLAYVNNGDYADSIVHRSVPGFVVQGGGFFYDPGVPLSAIAENAPVINEPEFANLRGTIAMARPPTGVNSATNQWFINLSDNTTTLDGQDFAVFGEVVGNGMDVVDSIAALPTFAFASPFNEIPLANYSNTDFNNNVPVDDTHLIIFSAVIVSDATVDSAGAAGLNPAPNTTTNTPPTTPPPTSGGGGGGSIGISWLFGALLLILSRRRTAQV